MGLQIDGTGSDARINPYSRSFATGKKPQDSEANGAGSVEPKPETGKLDKGLSTMPRTEEASASKQDPQKEAQVQRQIQELIQIQNKVIVHEQAHMSAGGELAGGASYSYTTGPDGKRYITGGEVSISIPSVKEPDEKLRMMAKVRAAALAPADPSPQDMRVAASAGAKEAEARMELARKRMETAYGNSPSKTESSQKSQKAVPGSALDLSV